MKHVLRSLFLTCFVIFSIGSGAQTMQWAWSKSYGSTGGEAIQNIATDSKNGIYSSGSFGATLQVGTYNFTSTGGVDILLLKHDTSGNLLWAKTFGGTANDAVTNISTDWNGNIFIAGYFSNSISFDSFSMTSSAGNDGFLVKLNSSGAVLWAKRIGGNSNDLIDVVKCYKDDIYIGGRYLSTDFNIDGISLTNTHPQLNFYAKLNATGQALWAKKGTSLTTTPFPFTDIEIIDDYSVHLFGSMYSSNVNFNPAPGSGGMSIDLPIAYHVKVTTNGDFINQAQTGQNTRSVVGRVAMGKYKKAVYSGGTSTLTPNPPKARLIKRDSANLIITANGANAVIPPSSPSQPPTTTSNTNDVAISQDEGVIAVGYFGGSTSFNFGFATPVLPGFEYGAGLIWKMDSFLITRDILTSAITNKFSTIFRCIAIDTTTNIAYAGGSFSKNTTDNNFFIGPDTLIAQGSGDMLISKIYLGAAAPAPLVAHAGNDTTICNGGAASIGVGATGGSPAYSYRWSPATGLQNPDAATTTANPTTTTTYVLRITDSHLTTVTDTIIVNVTPPLPQPIITASGPTTFCEGGSVTLTSSAAASYLWSNGATTQSITVNAAGNYSVITYNATACSSTASAPVTISVISYPAQPVITASGLLSFCAGGSVTLTSTPANSYLWSNGATTQNITVTTSGNYSVVVTNAGGCSSVSSDPVAVNIFASPVQPTVTASGALQFCAGGSVILTAPAASSYTWSNGATTQSITVNTTGNYSVVVTNTNGCSSVASAPVAVTVWPTPALPSVTASGPLQFCDGSSVTLTSSPANSYTWSNGATTQSITAMNTGTYSVIATSTEGCNSVASAPIAVTVWSNPAKPVISASGPLQFCDGGSVSLHSTTATSYIWSNGAAIQNIIVTTSGNYSVVVSNTQGCSSPVSDPVAITVWANPSQPVVSASGPLQFCQGNSVTFTSTSGNSYSWSNGATTQSITVNTAGDFSVVTSSAEGCSSVASAVNTTLVNPLPPVPVISREGNLLLSTASDGNQWYLDGIAIAGTTSNTVLINGFGNYTVSVTNSFGCQSISAPFTVNGLLGNITVLRNGDRFIHMVRPNPANSQSTVNFQLARSSKVGIALIGEKGYLVANLMSSRQLAAGNHQIRIDNFIKLLPAGMYFIRYIVNYERITDKLLIIK